MARYALIVGITEYSHLPRLSKAAEDAEAIARLLQQHGNFENIKPLPAHWLLAEKREAVSAQQLLTGELLGQALQTFLLEQADGKDALIYFSGHGITTTDSLGEQEGYLAASNCQVEQKNG
ncbi:caspase family protein [Oculatella sp. FACHB-28]|uniref:caspase family protein n=1 Tax=Oculatella sp. FACHB-28 TaxID=2692845 RepID=UPI001689ED0D|nr:caspase family protein [Oculatella sp. FACHB-28]MBD2059830.1 caspase family protein [Oculatella sp. FACHB-28]